MDEDNEDSIPEPVPKFHSTPVKSQDAGMNGDADSENGTDQSVAADEVSTVVNDEIASGPNDGSADLFSGDETAGGTSKMPATNGSVVSSSRPGPKSKKSTVPQSEKESSEDEIEQSRGKAALAHSTPMDKLGKRLKIKPDVNKGDVGCTACGKKFKREPWRLHPVLNVLVCKKCLVFYNSGGFTQDEDGIDEQCRWCGQGGHVVNCDCCPTAFCKKCIERNVGKNTLKRILNLPEWKCFKCEPDLLSPLVKQAEIVIKKQDKTVAVSRTGRAIRKAKRYSSSSESEAEKGAQKKDSDDENDSEQEPRKRIPSVRKAASKSMKKNEVSDEESDSDHEVKTKPANRKKHAPKSSKKNAASDEDSETDNRKKTRKRQKAVPKSDKKDATPDDENNSEEDRKKSADTKERSSQKNPEDDEVGSASSTNQNASSDDENDTQKTNGDTNEVVTKPKSKVVDDKPKTKKDESCYSESNKETSDKTKRLANRKRASRKVDEESDEEWAGEKSKSSRKSADRRSGSSGRKRTSAKKPSSSKKHELTDDESSLEDNANCLRSALSRAKLVNRKMAAALQTLQSRVGKRSDLRILKALRVCVQHTQTNYSMIEKEIESGIIEDTSLEEMLNNSIMNDTAAPCTSSPAKSDLSRLSQGDGEAAGAGCPADSSDVSVADAAKATVEENNSVRMDCSIANLSLVKAEFDSIDYDASAFSDEAANNETAEMTSVSEMSIADTGAEPSSKKRKISGSVSGEIPVKSGETSPADCVASSSERLPEELSSSGTGETGTIKVSSSPYVAADESESDGPRSDDAGAASDVGITFDGDADEVGDNAVAPLADDSSDSVIMQTPERSPLRKSAPKTKPANEQANDESGEEVKGPICKLGRPSDNEIDVADDTDTLASSVEKKIADKSETADCTPVKSKCSSVASSSTKSERSSTKSKSSTPVNKNEAARRALTGLCDSSEEDNASDYSSDTENINPATGGKSKRSRRLSVKKPSIAGSVVENDEKEASPSTSGKQKCKKSLCSAFDSIRVDKDSDDIEKPKRDVYASHVVLERFPDNLVKLYQSGKNITLKTKKSKITAGVKGGNSDFSDVEVELQSALRLAKKVDRDLKHGGFSKRKRAGSDESDGSNGDEDVKKVENKPAVKKAKQKEQEQEAPSSPDDVCMQHDDSDSNPPVPGSLFGGGRRMTQNEKARLLLQEDAMTSHSEDEQDEDMKKPTKKDKKEAKAAKKGMKDSESEGDSDKEKNEKKPVKKGFAKQPLLEIKLSSDSESDDCKSIKVVKGKGKPARGAKKAAGQGRNTRRNRVGSDTDDDIQSINASDSDVMSDDSDKPKNKGKRRRIKKNTSDSEQKSDDDEEDSPSKTPGGRKNIREIKSAKKETRKAGKEEEERRKRVEELQKEYNQETENDGDRHGAITTKLVLVKDPETNEPLVEVAPTLIRKLKPHQVEGVKFMWASVVESVERYKKSGGAGCILAHCMGLGKTLQVLTFLHTLMNFKTLRVKRALVVCPLSTVLNWFREAEMWLCDELEMEVLEMASAKKMIQRVDKLQYWHKHGGIMIIGYEMFRNLLSSKSKIKKKDREVFNKTLLDPGPDIVVCDEGHLLKNEQTALSKTMNLVKTQARIILTGTPLQNNLSEYHCMVNFIKPSLLGTRREFLNRFVNPISNGQSADSTPYDVRLMKRRSHILHNLLAGCVQRRDYNVLTPFLPPKHEYVLSIRLSELQVKLYEHYLENHCQRNMGMGGGKGLFADFQWLMKIWTHPHLLNLMQDRADVKAAKEEEERDSFLDDESDTDLSGFVVSSSEDSDVECLSDGEGTSKKKKKKKKKSKDKIKKDADSSCEEVEPDFAATATARTTRAQRAAAKANGTVAEEDDGTGMSMAVTSAEDELMMLGDTVDMSKRWWLEFMGSEKEHHTKIEYSGKLLVLFDILRECEAIGDKVLVFSQSLFSLDLIEFMLRKEEEAMDKTRAEPTNANAEGTTSLADTVDWVTGSWSKGLDYFRLDGSTAAEHRRDWINTFNNEENLRARLFLISTRAGSLGINLCSANRVVIFDASWNPSHDIQSIFRVYRFGQTKPVYIYRFLAYGAMEEKIYDRQVTKQSLACRVVDEMQIERHFNLADLTELYRFEPKVKKDRLTPKVPKDRLLAELLIRKRDWIVGYHEHDSLLENKEDEGLTEEERQEAWKEYEDEKKGLLQAANLSVAGGTIQNLQYLNQLNSYHQMINGMQPFKPTADVAGIIKGIKEKNPHLSDIEVQAKVQGTLMTVRSQCANYRKQLTDSRARGCASDADVREQKTLNDRVMAYENIVRNLEGYIRGQNQAANLQARIRQQQLMELAQAQTQARLTAGFNQYQPQAWPGVPGASNYGLTLQQAREAYQANLMRQHSQGK